MTESSSAPTNEELNAFRSTITEKDAFKIVTYLTKEYPDWRVVRSLVWTEYYEWIRIFGYTFEETILNALSSLETPEEGVIYERTIRENACEALYKFQEVTSCPNRFHAIIEKINAEIPVFSSVTD